MSELAHTNHTEKKDFLVRSSSLKDVRSFCREVFEKCYKRIAIAIFLSSTGLKYQKKKPGLLP